MTRKDFFKNILFISAAGAGGAAFINACTSENGEGNTGKDSATVRNRWSEDPCKDVSGLSKEEIATRQEYEYVGKSPHHDNYCGNCAHYIKPKEGQDCARCDLIPGPVNPLGYCDGWMEAANKSA